MCKEAASKNKRREIGNLLVAQLQLHRRNNIDRWSPQRPSRQRQGQAKEEEEMLLKAKKQGRKERREERKKERSCCELVSDMRAVFVIHRPPSRPVLR